MDLGRTFASSVEQPMNDSTWIGLGAAAWVLGVVSLLCDHFQAARPVIIGMHTLFGVGVSGAIGLVLLAKTRALEGACQAELYLFTRLVSRWVYILMYLLAIVRVGLYFYESGQHCSFCGARGAVRPVRALDDFQFYVSCCVVSLWVLRAAVLSSVCERRAQVAVQHRVLGG